MTVTRMALRPNGLAPKVLSSFAYSIGSGYVRWGHSDGFLFAPLAHCPRYYSTALEWSEGSIPADFTGGITSSAAIPS